MKRPELWGPLRARYESAAPRKMLALDGGGIRGVLTLQILKSIETQLGTKLCDYFDYIAGTSTGAIIAAGLANRHVGRRTDRLLPRDRDRDVPADALPRAPEQPLSERPAAAAAQGRIRAAPTSSRATEDPVAGGHSQRHHRLAMADQQQPRARYNLPERDDCNLCIPLWQLVRASTAAPIYFRRR